MKNTMKTKNVGFGILLMLVMLAFAPLEVQAYSPDPPSPTIAEYEAAIATYMQGKYSELGSLDPDDWDFELGTQGSDSGYDFDAWIRWRVYYRDADVNGSGYGYEFEWSGEAKIVWYRYLFTDNWYYFWEFDEYDYCYEEFWAIEVDDHGPGTTVPRPGTYYVKDGESYCFTAEAAVSEEPDDYYFKFVKWTVSGGPDVFSTVISGTADRDMTITAIFKTGYISSCNIIYEDGLSGGYLWRDDHVVLAITTKPGSFVTVTILNDYGAYERIFHTDVRSLCIYFAATRFDCDYELEVTATNGQPYTPRYILAGREGIMD